MGAKMVYTKFLTQLSEVLTPSIRSTGQFLLGFTIELPAQICKAVVLPATPGSNSGELSINCTIVEVSISCEASSTRETDKTEDPSLCS